MKSLPIVNLVGVLCLVVLSITQWRRDRVLNIEINRLESVRQSQAVEMSEMSKLIEGVNQDLEDLRVKVGEGQKELLAAQGRLAAGEREVLLAVAARDVLKSSGKEWTEAVALRDKRFHEVTAQNRRLAEELNLSIAKFNALGTNYNVLVQELNELRRVFTNRAAIAPE